MNQAWSMLFEGDKVADEVADEVADDSPADISWDDFPKFFLQKTNISFC